MRHLPIRLLYNHRNQLPFLLSSTLQLNEWTISIDKDLMPEAAIVVFHLPTLYESFPETLEKSEGQLWVGWKLTNEPNIIETVDTVWERLFDLHLNYPYKCYWECATTHGRNAVSIAEKYSLLEYLTVLSRKVDFMLIGTQKGGSTALHEYLHQHPACWGSYFKEPGFFLFPNIYSMGLP